MRLLCTVRGCGRELVRSCADESRSSSNDSDLVRAGSIAGARGLAIARDDLECDRGHSFNVARSGYVNLLQPQDRRSRAPGDSKAVVAARRRLFDGGSAAPLVEALIELARSLGIQSDSAVLDVGCGEGSMLAAIARELGVEAWGIDISTPAIDAAARRFADVHWLVANADRALPFADDSFALVLSITGRRNAAELARVARGEAHALFVIPAEDDQCELRAAVLGRATREDRFASLASELGSAWALESRTDVRWSRRHAAAELRDLLATTYRGARKREQERVAELGELAVTSSYAIGCFRKA